MPPLIAPTVIPTGGAISLDYRTASGAISISRATSGASGLSSFTTLYSGSALGPQSGGGGDQFYLDVGDLLPGPLDATAQWVYQITDQTGTTQTAALVPVSHVTLEPDPLTKILIRLLQAGIQNVVPPQGIDRARVSLAMPITNLPVLPLVVIAPELDQMEEQPIGVDVPKPDQNNAWQILDIQKRVYRVSILSLNAPERDFYKAVVIGIFRSILGSVLGRIGQDIRHGYQAATYQQTSQPQDQVPGFYGCDVMLDITGMFSVSVTTNYGLITAVSALVQTTLDQTGPDAAPGDSVTINVTVPVAP